MGSVPILVRCLSVSCFSSACALSDSVPADLFYNIVRPLSVCSVDIPSYYCRLSLQTAIVSKSLTLDIRHVQRDVLLVTVCNSDFVVELFCHFCVCPTEKFLTACSLKCYVFLLVFFVRTYRPIRLQNVSES